MSISPFLIPCLVTLRAEFNALNPTRDKASDGWIGDAAHQAGTSDHNPDSLGRVLAIDITSAGPWPVPFGDLVEELRADTRLEYIIWNRRIASRDQNWTWRNYTGTSDPHTNHAHFSARHDHTEQNSIAPWGLDTVDQEADVNVDDLVTNTSKSGAPDTPLGHFALSQGVPDGTDAAGARVPYWVAFQHLGQAVTALEKKVDQLIAKTPQS